ncbi:MAG: hypothetical protein Q9190_005406 [Brigantiaea leucoxantha]
MTRNPGVPLQRVAYQFPGTDNDFNDDQQTRIDYEQQTPDHAIANLKDLLSVLKYHQIGIVSGNLVHQARRVGVMFNNMETEIGNGDPNFQPKGLQAE